MRWSHLRFVRSSPKIDNLRSVTTGKIVRTTYNYGQLRITTDKFTRVALRTTTENYGELRMNYVRSTDNYGQLRTNYVRTTYNYGQLRTNYGVITELNTKFVRTQFLNMSKKYALTTDKP